jgi:hypothetical protein
MLRKINIKQKPEVHPERPIGKSTRPFQFDVIYNAIF